MTNKELETKGVDLLFHIWRAIDSDFKSKYKREIWAIFEARALVSAKQNGTLRGFATQLARATQAELGKNEKARQSILEILECGWDEDILSIIRNSTSYLVLHVRNRMSIIKEEFENDHN
jgi:hypothetical protein